VQILKMTLDYLQSKQRELKRQDKMMSEVLNHDRYLKKTGFISSV